MNTIIFFICALFSSLHAPLSSAIIEAYDLKEIAAHFDKLDADSLLLWDVDSTLIMPADQVLRPGNEDDLNEFEIQYLGSKTQQEKDGCSAKFFIGCPSALLKKKPCPLSLLFK